MTAKFDALGYAHRLEQAGVPKDQASVHAEALRDVLSDVVFSRQLADVEDRLRSDMREMEERLTHQIQLVRTELHGEIVTLEATLRGEITALRAEFNQLKWMMGITIGLIIALIVKLLVP